MKKMLIFFMVFVTSTLLWCATPSGSEYPHWNLNDSNQVEQLQKIENMIEQSKNIEYPIAIFDWDGTLADEILPNFQIETGKYGEAKYALSGQADLFTWGAQNYTQVSGKVFPTWQNTSIPNVSGGGEVGWQQGVYNMVEMLEGHTNVATDGFENYVLNSTSFVNGMDVGTYTQLVTAYAKTPEFSPENTIFLRQLDVLQRLRSAGIHCYIVTGSSPYFVAALLKSIENSPTLLYKATSYNFHSGENMTTVPNDISKSFVIGNSAVVTSQGGKSIFSNRYNNYWVQTDSGSSTFYVVDNYGKELVARNLELVNNGMVVFVAGNSNGDYYDMNYMLTRSKIGVGMAVNARGDKFVKLVKSGVNSGRIISTTTPILTLNTSSSTVILKLGESFTLQAWCEPVMSGKNDTISLGKLVYQSSNTHVTVSNSGLITAQDKGSSVVSVSFTYKNEFGVKNTLTKNITVIVQ